jgi:hypothetical protein
LFSLVWNVELFFPHFWMGRRMFAGFMSRLTVPGFDLLAWLRPLFPCLFFCSLSPTFFSYKTKKFRVSIVLKCPTSQNGPDVNPRSSRRSFYLFVQQINLKFVSKRENQRHSNRMKTFLKLIIRRISSSLFLGEQLLKHSKVQCS